MTADNLARAVDGSPRPCDNEGMTPELDKRLRQAAQVLRSHGAREVYVFGSALTGRLREDSDIDLAVVGLPARVFFRAMGDAREILGRPVDLVDLDKSGPFTDYLRGSQELQRVG